MKTPSTFEGAKACLTDGVWVSTDDAIAVVDPSDGMAFTEIAAGGAAQVDAAVNTARAAFDGGDRSKLTAVERGRLLSKLGAAVEADAEALAQSEARDTGKPLKQARADLAATARHFEDEADAVRMANGADYGLVAGVWIGDACRQTRMAKAIRAGQLFLNAYGAGGGIKLRSGGVRKSGHGREKGFAALHEFSQLKTVVQNHG